MIREGGTTLLHKCPTTTGVTCHTCQDDEIDVEMDSTSCNQQRRDLTQPAYTTVESSLAPDVPNWRRLTISATASARAHVHRNHVDVEPWGDASQGRRLPKTACGTTSKEWPPNFVQLVQVAPHYSGNRRNPLPLHTKLVELWQVQGKRLSPPQTEGGMNKPVECTIASTP